MSDKFHSNTTELYQDWITKLVAWAGVFIAPIKLLLINVYLLVCIDLITGIWASLVEKQKIVSNKLRRTINKLLSYTAALLVTHHLTNNFLTLGLDAALVKILAGYIAITEVKSIFENLYRATHLNFWQMLLKKLNWANKKLDEKIDRSHQND